MSIDLSTLPKPTLVEVDHATILSERLASLEARFAEQDIEWDTANIAGEPAVILQREDGFREMLDRQSINDMAVARTIGFAQGADLDWLAATLYADLGLERLPGEKDDRFTRRILLAGDARSMAATEDGIVFFALSASLDVADARAIKISTGIIDCVVRPVATVDPAAVITAVHGAIYQLGDNGRQRRKLAGDEINIRLATVFDGAITARVRLASGAAGVDALARSRTAMISLADDARLSIGRAIALDEIIATGRVAGIARIDIDAPVGDLDPGADGVLDLTVSVEKADG